MATFYIAVSVLFLTLITQLVPLFRSEKWRHYRIVMGSLAAAIALLTLAAMLNEKEQQKQAATAQKEEEKQKEIAKGNTGTLGPVSRLDRRNGFTIIGGGHMYRQRANQNVFETLTMGRAPLDNHLGIDDIDGNLVVNAKLFRPNGVLCEIITNAWKIRPDAWRRNFDRNHFEVLDEFGDVAFQIALHSDQVIFQARVYDRDGLIFLYGVEETKDGLGGTIAFGRSEETNKIASMFKYPSETHQGEYAGKPICYRLH